MQLLQHIQRLDAVSNPHSGVPLEAVCGTLQALLETLFDPELLHLHIMMLSALRGRTAIEIPPHAWRISSLWRGRRQERAP